MSQTKSESSPRITKLDEALSAGQGGDASDISFAVLSTLSDLNSNERKDFERIWNKLNPALKRGLLGHLKTLAEDSVEYDFGTIFKLALNDPDDIVREEAIEGLWENEEPSFLRRLLGLLKSDPSNSVREAAAIAIGRFTVLAECHKIEVSDIGALSQALLGIVQEPSQPLRLRCLALEALAPLSMSDVTKAIWGAYRHDEPEMRLSAIKAMGLNRDLLWAPTIVSELTNDHPETRFAATKAAGAIGSTDAVFPLAELTGDPDPEVRVSAIEALGEIGGDEARQALKLLLEDNDPSIQLAATRAMAEVELFEAPLAPDAM